MRISRAWAMPNKRTFRIKPIADLLAAEIGDGVWVDPFAGDSVLASITNDLNPDFDTDFHMDALEFLSLFPDNGIDGLLYDPPFSPRQITESYKRFGCEVTQETTQSHWYTMQKEQIKRIVKPGGKVICFGWNSNGIGGDFSKVRILLVAHGGWHNDTIVTVEYKLLRKRDADKLKRR